MGIHKTVPWQGKAETKLSLRLVHAGAEGSCACERITESVESLHSWNVAALPFCVPQTDNAHGRLRSKRLHGSTQEFFLSPPVSS